MVDPCMQFQDMQSYWDIPDMHAGVVTGKVAWSLLEYCKAKSFSLQVSNCTGSSSSCNELLEEAASIGMPAYISFSQGSASAFAGKSLPNDKGKYQAAILGACAGAHYVRYVAPHYGIPVLVTSDHCTKEFLPWFDGMLEADEVFYKEHGEPLFTSHTLERARVPDDEYVGTCKEYFNRMARVGLILELGVRMEIDNSKLYWPPKRPRS
jgi:fructose-bisphosphate aldolase class II